MRKPSSSSPTTDTSSAPPKQRRTRKGAGIATALVAATAVGLAGQAGTTPAPAPASFDLDGICSMKGNAKTPAEENFNQAKNRYDMPEDGQFIDGSSHVDGTGAQTGADNKPAWDVMFDPSTVATSKALQPQPALNQKAVGLTGYVLNARPGGDESCNCKQSDPHKDVHIYLSPLPITPSTTLADCVIVEITPRVRRERGKDDVWTAANIQQTMAGKKVVVEGWLFYDFEHVPNSVIELTKNGSSTAKAWRKTCWEVHPVTDIQLAP